MRMIFKNKLVPAKLIKRYKRFLADVVLTDGSTMTVYCPNTGSMRSCSTPGSRVMISKSNNSKRKYQYTLEVIDVGTGWIGINTSLTNSIVAEAIGLGIIDELQDVDAIHTEVKTSAHTRLDLMVEKGDKKIFIEIKNCSLVEEGVAMFPDAVTSRGTKHLLELAELVRQGNDGIIFYLVQRMDAQLFKPAAHIDPVYAETLQKVRRQGVKIAVYQAKADESGIEVTRKLPYSLR